MVPASIEGSFTALPRALRPGQCAQRRCDRPRLATRRLRSVGSAHAARPLIGAHTASSPSDSALVPPPRSRHPRAPSQRPSEPRASARCVKRSRGSAERNAVPRLATVPVTVTVRGSALSLLHARRARAVRGRAVERRHRARARAPSLAPAPAKRASLVSFSNFRRGASRPLRGSLSRAAPTPLRGLLPRDARVPGNGGARARHPPARAPCAEHARATAHAEPCPLARGPRRARARSAATTTC